MLFLPRHVIMCPDFPRVYARGAGSCYCWIQVFTYFRFQIFPCFFALGSRSCFSDFTLIVDRVLFQNFSGFMRWWPGVVTSGFRFCSQYSYVSDFPGFMHGELGLVISGFYRQTSRLLVSRFFIKEFPDFGHWEPGLVVSDLRLCIIFISF